MAPPPPPAVRRVHPGPAETVSVADAYSVDRPQPGGSEMRPWIGICMVTSLDGSVTVAGTSGGLGNANDRDVLLTLRAHADVVIVGAATARGEGYGAPRDDVRIGVVTNSGRIDPTSELFRSGAGFVITSETAIVEGDVEVLRAGDDRVDLHAALGRLADVVPDVGYVHAEGGPTLNGSLLEFDLVDEIAMTVAPVMVGGSGPRATAGSPEALRRFDLAHLLVDDDGYTFGRWVRRVESRSRPGDGELS